MMGMSLGLGIFASVVLVLAVYNRGFRKFLMWATAIVASLTLLVAGGIYAYDKYKAHRAAQNALKPTSNRFQPLVYVRGGDLLAYVPPSPLSPEDRIPQYATPIIYLGDQDYVLACGTSGQPRAIEMSNGTAKCSK